MKEEALATITEKQVENFVRKTIICIYEIQWFIIANNGTQFQGNFKEFCDNLHPALVPSLIKTHQTNGQAKATNKKILEVWRRR